MAEITRLFLHDGLVLSEQAEVQPIGRDTAYLAEATDAISGHSALVIGCGNGLLALRLARRGFQVAAVDINHFAVSSCGRNSILNGLEESVQTIRADIRQIEGIGKFDLIVSNPPQLPTGRSEVDALKRSWISVANDGGPDGREFIDWLCENASRFLASNGVLMFTHFDYLDLDKTVRHLESNGFLVAVDEGLPKTAGAFSRERLHSLGLKLDQYRVLVVSARLED